MSILVVIATSEEAGPLVRWGARFARARQTNLRVLQVSRGAKPSEPKPMIMRDATDQNPVRQAIRAAVGENLVKQMTVRYQTHQVRRALELERERDDDTNALKKSAAAGEAAEPLRIERLKKTDAALEMLKSESFLTVRAVTHPSRQQAVLDEIKVARASLLVVGNQEKLSGEQLAADLGQQLLSSAPCDLMLIRASGTSGEKCERVLIPAAGGPHAQVALRIGRGLAKHDDAEISPLFVCVRASAEDEDEAKEVGLKQLERTIKQAGVTTKIARIKPRVVLANTPQAGIGSAAKDGYDLVLVGASNQGFMSRVLFGTVPARLLEGKSATAIAVVRKARPLSTRAVEALDTILNKWFPPLQREDRVALFAGLHSGSRFNVDFAMLIALSTAIAALGLMQNSGAVVIGAMLVAPLMTPMIAAGLALVQGNTILVRDAFWTIGKGFVLALLIGVMCGLLGKSLGLMPHNRLTPELIARGAPNALDLVVAFLSGLAAAYALARPNLSGALPGVAIAAALVPPIGTVGIALALGHTEIASGAALLFGTNLVAIVLGAAAVFRAIGVHGSNAKGSRSLWARRALVGLIVVAIGLASWFASRLPIWVRGHDLAPVVVTDRLRDAVEERVHRNPALTVLLIRADGIGLEVVVGASGSPTAALQSDLTQLAAKSLERDITVRLLFVRYESVSPTVAPVGSDSR
jgi:uncharacterized hydrophobic protein (TIGR00271 family)